MKANELMIGDWVKCKDPKCEGHQIDLIDLGNEEVGLDGEIDNFEDICPIPITQEILEKNGFVFNHDIFDGIYPMVNIIYCDYKLLADDGKYINGGETNNIKYVHELQHALKLCGIEKEIVL
jgi:hypothetical protein